MNAAQPPMDPRRRGRMMRSVTYGSLAVAMTLVVAKTWAYRATDSVSILSSLADSMLDVVASLVTFWAIRFSLSPADREHRFGHGKSEGLAALMQSAIISASGVYVSAEAVRRLVAPTEVAEPSLGIGVIAFATVLTFALVMWQRHVSRVTGSIAVAADAMHYKSDLAVNVVVAGAVALAALPGLRWIDPLTGFGVALYLLYSGWGIASHSLAILLDREIPDADRKRIRAIATSHPQVLGFHDLRTRHGGSGYIVQFHLELDPGMPLLEIHPILDEVERQIEEAYPGCEIIIHPDPLGYAERRDHFEAKPRPVRVAGSQR